MIITPCSRCCFLKKDSNENPVCSDDQKINIINNIPCAFGFCRTFRTKEWASNKDKNQLIQLAHDSSKLISDLIILFDSNNQTYTSIDKTLRYMPKYLKNKIIIIDISGNKDKKKIASDIEYIKTSRYNVNNNMCLQKLMDNCSNEPEIALRKSIQLIKSKYFLLLKAGQEISDFRNIKNNINDIKSRYLFWYFRYEEKDVILTPKNPVYGLYITSAYKKLTANSNKSFLEIINKDENEMIISLSHCLDCYLFVSGETIDEYE